MKTTLTLESLASQCDLRSADRVVPGWRLSGDQKMYIKKRKQWVIYKKFVGNSFAHLKHNVVSQISLKINKTSSYLANEVKIGGGGWGVGGEFDYSL